jgi:hypothetical protein
MLAGQVLLSAKLANRFQRIKNVEHLTKLVGRTATDKDIFYRQLYFLD